MVTVHGVDPVLDTEDLVSAAGAHARGRPGAGGALVHGALDHSPAVDLAALTVVPAAMAHPRVHRGLRSRAHGLIAARPWPRLRPLPQASLLSPRPLMARL